MYNEYTDGYLRILYMIGIIESFQRKLLKKEITVDFFRFSLLRMWKNFRELTKEQKYPKNDMEQYR